MIKLRNLSTETLEEFSRRYEIEKVIMHEALRTNHFASDVRTQLVKDLMVVEKKCFLVDQELKRRKANLEVTAKTEAPLIVPCPTCKGFGNFNGVKGCPDCDGTGKAYAPFLKDECPGCHGQGGFQGQGDNTDIIECLDCGGTGKRKKL